MSIKKAIVLQAQLPEDGEKVNKSVSKNRPRSNTAETPGKKDPNRP